MQAVPLMRQLLWIQAPVAMARPWPVDFLINALISIYNHMSSWTWMSCNFIVTVQFLLSLVETPAALSTFFVFRFYLWYFNFLLFFLLWGLVFFYFTSYGYIKHYMMFHVRDYFKFSKFPNFSKFSKISCFSAVLFILF